MSALQLVAVVSFNKNVRRSDNVIHSDGISVDNRLSSMYAALALSSKTSNFFKTK